MKEFLSMLLVVVFWLPLVASFRNPTYPPTAKPTPTPSYGPTAHPTSQPVTIRPTSQPVTRRPSSQPATQAPTVVSCATPPPTIEINALNALYIATNGQQWKWESTGTHWDFTTTNPNPCDNWQGITCQVAPSLQICAVATLELSNYGLKGTIPTSIANLQYVNTLVLSKNSKLVGSIPSSITNMTALVGLGFGTNSLNGSIPQDIGNLVNLEGLDLHANDLTGTIPTSITNLTRLALLKLYSNALHGSIPEDIGALTSLQYLSLSVNHLSGTIPPSITNLSLLYDLELNNNTLHGPLPDTIGDLVLLQTLHIDNNQLSGTFPISLTTLSSLTTLISNINNMVGPIPAAIGNMVSLVNLQLNSNYFSGTIPNSITNLVQLTDLQYLNNQLHGDIPADIWKFTQLSTFFFFYNYFSGTIPSALTSMSELDDVDFSYNYLHGKIPENIGNLTEVSSLNLNGNLLTGTIPASITNMSSVELFAINDNLLHGNLPGDINKLTEMNYFDVANNFFSGEIPSSIAALSDLESCYLDGNQFTGVVTYLPTSTHQLFLSNNLFHGSLDWISKVPNTFSLILNNNSFSGTLPTVISTLHSLVAFTVQGNMLTGPIYNIFDPSKQLSVTLVDLSDNTFTGSFPSSIFQFPILGYFAAVSNCLTGSIPESICFAKSTLETLVLDGLHSAVSCQKKLLPAFHVIHTLAATRAIIGSIPACLFGEMDALQLLHISGNALTGELPDSYQSLGSQLRNLSLSHNSLTGTIPLAFQQHGWLNLDLSFNELTGDLTHNFNVSGLHSTNTSSGLALNNNRLSGDIPNSFIALPNIDVLAGNMFDCDNENREHTLPNQDKNYATYVCGSDETDSALITYLVVLVCMALGVYALKVVQLSSEVCENNQNAGMGAKLKEIFKEAKTLLELVAFTTSAADDDGKQGLSSFLKYTRQLQLHLVVVTSILGCIFLLVNGSLGAQYSSYSYRYVWSISTAYLSGLAPGICLFFFMFIVLLWLFLDVKWFGLCLSAESSSFQMLHRISSLMHIGMDSTQPTDLHNNDDLKPSTVSYVSFIQVHFKTLLWIGCCLTLNVVVVMFVNGGYVALIISNITAPQQAVLTVAMSLFKDGWSTMVMKSLRWDAAHGVEDILGDNLITRLVLAVCLFNNIVAPALATAFVNTNCFYYAVMSAPNVSTSAFLTGCLAYYNNGYCSQNLVLDMSTDYQPPFSYSFQCTSTLLALFAPVWIYMFLFSNIVRPVLSLCCTSYHPFALTYYYPLLLETLKAKLLVGWKASASAEEPVANKVILKLPKSILRSRELTIALCNNIAIMLCFGVLFPLLALAGCISLLIQLSWQQIYVQKIFLVCQVKTQSTTVAEIEVHPAAEEQGEDLAEIEIASVAPSATSNIVAEYPFLTQDVAKDILHTIQSEGRSFPFTYLNTVKSIVLYVSIIWGLFLWDIMGDEVGVQDACWAFLVLFVVGMCIRLQGYLFAKAKGCLSSRRQPPHHASFSKGVEMETNRSSTICVVENPMSQPVSVVVEKDEFHNDAEHPEQ